MENDGSQCIIVQPSWCLKELPISANVSNIELSTIYWHRIHIYIDTYISSDGRYQNAKYMYTISCHVDLTRYLDAKHLTDLVSSYICRPFCSSCLLWNNTCPALAVFINVCSWTFSYSRPWAIKENEKSLALSFPITKKAMS